MAVINGPKNDCQYFLEVYLRYMIRWLFIPRHPRFDLRQRLDLESGVMLLAEFVTPI